MTQTKETQFQAREAEAAQEQLRRPESWGEIPGAHFIRGPMLSWCCDAKVSGGLYDRKGLRVGMCSGCWKNATFREIITI